MSDKRLTNLALYVVRNQDGQFFRRKGYGGGGSSWVDDVATARFYVKIAGARTVVNYYTKIYPQYSVPDIVKLTVSETEVLDETERVIKAKAKRVKAEEEKEIREKSRVLRLAQEAYDKAKAALEAQRGM